jgi:hypothetical protein
LPASADEALPHHCDLALGHYGREVASTCFPLPSVGKEVLLVSLRTTQYIVDVFVLKTQDAELRAGEFPQIAMRTGPKVIPHNIDVRRGGLQFSRHLG